MARRAFLAGTFAATAWPAAGTASSMPRLVALDWSLIEVALTLGIVPVGAAEAGGYRIWVEKPVLPPGVADLGLRVQPNLELLRLLDPTLILTIPDRADIAPLLGRIAPVMSLPIYTAAYTPYANACAVTRALATRLGRLEAAEAAIRRAEDRIARARARLTGTEPPVVVVRFVDPHTVFVFGKGGLFDAMMDRLGIANGWPGPPTRWGFTQTSIVALARVDPRSQFFIIGPSISPDVAAMMRSDPIWRGMPFVRRGAVERLPPVWFFGATDSAARFAELLAEALAGGTNAG